MNLLDAAKKLPLEAISCPKINKDQFNCMQETSIMRYLCPKYNTMTHMSYLIATTGLKYMFKRQLPHKSYSLVGVWGLMTCLYIWTMPSFNYSKHNTLNYFTYQTRELQMRNAIMADQKQFTEENQDSIKIYLSNYRGMSPETVMNIYTQL